MGLVPTTVHCDIFSTYATYYQFLVSMKRTKYVKFTTNKGGDANDLNA